MFTCGAFAAPFAWIVKYGTDKKNGILVLVGMVKPCHLLLAQNCSMFFKHFV